MLRVVGELTNTHLTVFFSNSNDYNCNLLLHVFNNSLLISSGYTVDELRDYVVFIVLQWRGCTLGCPGFFFLVAIVQENGLGIQKLLFKNCIALA